MDILQTPLGSFILLVTGGIFMGASYFTSIWRWQPGCFKLSFSSSPSAPGEYL